MGWFRQSLILRFARTSAVSHSDSPLVSALFRHCFAKKPGLESGGRAKKTELSCGGVSVVFRVPGSALPLALPWAMRVDRIATVSITQTILEFHKMTKKVLNVGQCNPDNSSISRMLNENFDVQIVTAESHEEAVQLASETSFDLVLLNRIYDATGTEGMATLKALKEADSTRETPVMLVSNFQDAQEAAVSAGANQGFGKSALAEPTTIDRLQEFLAD